MTRKLYCNLKPWWICETSPASSTTPPTPTPSSRHAAGPPSGRQWWGEWRLRPGSCAQLPELLQPGFWEGPYAAGSWAPGSIAACSHARCVCVHPSVSRGEDDLAPSSPSPFVCVCVCVVMVFQSLSKTMHCWLDSLDKSQQALFYQNVTCVCVCNMCGNVLPHTFFLNQQFV